MQDGYLHCFLSVFRYGFIEYFVLLSSRIFNMPCLEYDTYDDT